MSNFNQFIQLSFAEDERSLRKKNYNRSEKFQKMASRSSLKTIQANEAMAFGKLHKLFSSLQTLRKIISAKISCSIINMAVLCKAYYQRI